MKKKLTIVLMIFLVIFTSEAKSNTKPETKITAKEVYGNDIPKEVTTWLTKELANTSTKVLENFETPAFYTPKKAKIIGYIKNYNQSLGAKTGIFYYTNQLTREQKPRVLEIHEDGRFELELPLEYPMQDYFVMENRNISFYLEPGQNLSIIMDWKDLKAKRTSWHFKEITYQGVLKKMNTDLLHYRPYYSHKNINKRMEEMEPLVFKKDLYRFKKHFLKKIRTYKESGEIDAKTSEVLENEIILSTYRYMLQCFSYSKQRKLEKEGVNVNDLIPKGYYNFIKELPLNKQSILINRDFGVFVNRLEFAPSLRFLDKGININTSVYIQELIKFIEDKGETLSTEDKNLITKLDEYSIGVLSDELKKKKKQFLAKNEKYIKEYLNLKKSKDLRQQIIKQNQINRWEKKDSVANNLGIKNSLIYEVLRSRSLKSHLDYDLVENKKWFWSSLKKDISSPQLIKMGDRLLEEKNAELDIYELPKNEAGTAIFNKIIAPYKGKVVVVQFWHLSSYYRGEDLIKMKERRDQYKDNKNVVFLNITNENRDSIEKYNESVKKNGFENSIRIPQDDYHYLRQLFKFTTSIKNVLIDKKGRVVNGYSSLYSLDRFLEEKLKINSKIL